MHDLPSCSSRTDRSQVSFFTFWGDLHVPITSLPASLRHTAKRRTHYRFASLAHLSSKANCTLYISPAGARTGPEDRVHYMTS